MTASIAIENKFIGDSFKTLLIAELSANHDRDLDQALELVEIASDAGWDCVKFQTYDANSLTVASNHVSMKIDPCWGTDNLRDLYDKAAMPMEFHEPLFERARLKGLLPFTTIYDPKDLDFVENLGCAVYKIASFELTYHDLLFEVASTHKPVILSTGMACLEEIASALEILGRNNSGPVVVLHCCSAYPAPFDSVNLHAMNTLRDNFGTLVGFSDHTIGSIVPIAASAMGAVAIEKHVTNDSTREGPDHRFSATPEVMTSIAYGIDSIYLAHGTGLKEVQEAESANKSIGRRSAFAMHKLAIGHIVQSQDFRFVRPGVGITADRRADLEGKTIVRPVQAFDPITVEDVCN